MIPNFYANNIPEYYWHQGKPHYNWGNKIYHSGFMKKFYPIRGNFHYVPEEYQQMPNYFSSVPQFTWLWGNLDYSFNKYHRLY